MPFSYCDGAGLHRLLIACRQRHIYVVRSRLQPAPALHYITFNITLYCPGNATLRYATLRYATLRFTGTQAVVLPGGGGKSYALPSDGKRTIAVLKVVQLAAPPLRERRSKLSRPPNGRDGRTTR